MHEDSLAEKRISIQAENDTAWSRLNKLLTKRDSPVIVWVTAENRDQRDQLFRQLKEALKEQYHHVDRNLADIKNLESFSLFHYLHQEAQSPNDQLCLCHLFGLEVLVTPAENDPAESFARELNFERELLFRQLPSSIVFWSDEAAQVRVQTLAPDFWDWLVYKFHFRMLPGTMEWQFKMETQLPGLATAIPENDKRQIDELEKRLNQLEPLLSKGGRFIADYAQVALDLGKKWFFFDNHAATARLFHEALPLFEKVGDDLGKANTLRSLGYLAYMMGENEEARSRYDAALPLYEKVGSDLGKANTLRSLGYLAYMMGENEEARSRYDAALPLYEKVGSDLGKADTLRSLGDLAYMMGENEEARSRYDAALPLYEKGGSDLGKANTLRGLGDLAYMMGENEEARSRYDSALPLFEKGGSDLGKANTLRSLGDLAYMMGENEEARSRYDAALPLFEKVGDNLGKANTLSSLGDLAWKKDKDGKVAMDYYKKAIALFRKIESMDDVTYTLTQLAKIQFHSGDNTSAYASIKDADTIAQKLQMPLLTNFVNAAKEEIGYSG